MIQADFSKYSLSDLYHKMQDSLQQATHLRQQAKKWCADTHGQRDDFLATLKWHKIDNADDPAQYEILQKAYALYASIFQIAEEIAPLENVVQAMKSSNTSTENQDGTTPSEESWIVACDNQNRVLGAINSLNIIATKHENDAQILIYIFIDPAFRSLGINEKLLEAAHQNAMDFFAKYQRKPRPYIQFGEQNNPYNMTARDILVDTICTQSHLLDRRQFFQDYMGFSVLDYTYLQPPLFSRADGGRPFYGLDFIARKIAPDGTRLACDFITADFLHFVLFNFFSKTVSGGHYDLNTEETWLVQNRFLQDKIRKNENIGMNAHINFKADKQRFDTVLHDICMTNSTPDFANATLSHIMKK